MLNAYFTLQVSNAMCCLMDWVCARDVQVQHACMKGRRDLRWREWGGGGGDGGGREMGLIDLI